MTTIELWQNNSGGGRFWISGDKDEAAMREQGWVPQSEDQGYGVRTWTLDVPTDSEDEALASARAAMFFATGFRGDEQGCDCCGSPFYLSEV